MDLEEKYKEETGFDVGKILGIGITYYSNDYVEWLEKQLLLRGVGVQSEQLFCENVIHQTCKYFDTYNGCMGCLVKNYEAK